MHEQEDRDVHHEQHRGDLQDPCIGIFLRSTGRMAAAIIMTVDSPATEMHRPPKGKHRARPNDDRQFIAMYALMNFENKPRHNRDQTEIGGKAHHRDNRRQNTAEHMTEFRHENGNRQMAVDTVQGPDFPKGLKPQCYSVAVHKSKIFWQL